MLLSSHILSEVEALADRVSIIRRGATVTTGSLADLRRQTRTTIRAVTRGDVPALASLPGVADESVSRVDGHVETRFTIGPEHLDDAVGRVHEAGISALTVHPPSLDALFLSQYADAGEPAEAAAGGDR